MTEQEGPAFIWQQLLAIVVVPFFLLAIFESFDEAHPGLPLAIYWASYFLGGLVCGYGLSTWTSRGPRVAQWVWVFPLGFWLLLFFLGCYSGGVHSQLKELLSVDGGSRIGVFLFTLPIVSALSYSLGAALRKRRNDRLGNLDNSRSST